MQTLLIMQNYSKPGTILYSPPAVSPVQSYREHFQANGQCGYGWNNAVSEMRVQSYTLGQLLWASASLL